MENITNPNAFSLTQFTNASDTNEGETGATLTMGNIHMLCESCAGGGARQHHLKVIDIETGVVICDVISDGNFPRLGAYIKDYPIHPSIVERMSLVIKCHANSNHYLFNV